MRRKGLVLGVAVGALVLSLGGALYLGQVGPLGVKYDRFRTGTEITRKGNTDVVTTLYKFPRKPPEVRDELRAATEQEWRWVAGHALRRGDWDLLTLNAIDSISIVEMDTIVPGLKGVKFDPNPIRYAQRLKEPTTHVRVSVREPRSWLKRMGRLFF